MMDMTEIYKNVRSHRAKLILCCPDDSCYFRYADIALFSQAPKELSKEGGLRFAYDMAVQIISDLYRHKYVVARQSGDV